jgi:hypothetical protein
MSLLFADRLDDLNPRLARVVRDAARILPFDIAPVVNVDGDAVDVIALTEEEEVDAAQTPKIVNAMFACALAHATSIHWNETDDTRFSIGANDNA